MSARGCPWLLWLGLLAMLGLACESVPPSAAPPSDPVRERIFSGESAVAVYSETNRHTGVAITGGGFGKSVRGASIEIHSPDFSVSIPASDRRVLSWDDRRIQLDLPRVLRAKNTRITVRPGAGGEMTFSQLDELYRYDFFDVPLTQGYGSNRKAPPVAIAIDGADRVWANQEFHLDFQMWGPKNGQVHALPIPKPRGKGPFAAPLFGRFGRTQVSQNGEDIIVDPRGRIWLSQGGGLYAGDELPNHSRIVQFDPGAPKKSRYRVYNIPGNYNEVMGLAWDERRKRLWFTSNAHKNDPSKSGYRPARLTSFDPEAIPFENQFDFSRSLRHRICKPGEPHAECYREYLLPPKVYQVAHVALDSAGHVWFTGYWMLGPSSEIGRLDPESGQVWFYPLSKPRDASNLLKSGPWQIARAPDGNMVFTEFFEASLGRFEVARANDPACARLDASGRNPCILELRVQNPLRGYRIHSLAFDDRERMWFGLKSDEDPHGRTLGHVNKEWNRVVLLPSFSIFPGERFQADGVAFNPRSRQIWFAEYWNYRLGRLTPQP